MLAARERLGLSQKQAAEIADVGTDVIGRLERLDFSDVTRSSRFIQSVDRIAGALEVTREDILPDGIAGLKLPSRFRKCFDIPVDEAAKLNQLPDAIRSARLDLPTPREDQQELNERIKLLLRTLSYREREVLKLRYGLDGDGEYTLEESARIFQTTRERIRMVEAKAIRKLQHPLRAKKLESFIAPAH